MENAEKEPPFPPFFFFFFFTCLLGGMRGASSEAFYSAEWRDSEWGEEKKYHRGSKREMRAKGFKQVDYKWQLSYGS